MAKLSFPQFSVSDRDLSTVDSFSPWTHRNSDYLSVVIGEENGVVSSSEWKNQRVEDPNLIRNDVIALNGSRFRMLGLVDQEDDDYYIARRRENVSGICDGDSSRVNVWIESGSDDDVEGIGKGSRGIHGSRNCDGGSSGVVLIDSDSDEEIDRVVTGMRVCCDEKVGRNCESESEDEVEGIDHVLGGMCVHSNANGSRICDGSSTRVSGSMTVCGDSDDDEVEEIGRVLSGMRGQSGENGSRNCDENSSRVSGLRAVWGDSESDDEGEGIDGVLGGMCVKSYENGSRNCDGSSTRVSGSRVVWGDSDDDGVEGIDRVGMCVHSDENLSRNCDGTSPRVSGFRAAWGALDSDDDVEGIGQVIWALHSHIDENDAKNGNGSSPRVRGFRAARGNSDSDDDEVEGIDQVLTGMHVLSDENGSRNCHGSSPKVSGFRVAWGNSDSDDDVERIDQVLRGMHVHSDANVSRNSDASSTRVGRFRAAWGNSDSDDDEAEGIEHILREMHAHCDANGSRNDESSSRATGSRAVWGESDSDDDVEGIDHVLRGMLVHSDDDEEDFGVENVNDDGDGDSSVPLRWDSIHLEEANRDFEWEEVDDGAGEMEVLRFMADPEDEEDSTPVVIYSGLEEDGERGRELSNLEWEVLFNVDNLNSNNEMENESEPYLGDHDDFINTTEYEMMFGQFADGESVPLGRPPASKAVVEKLPSVVMTKEDVLDEKSHCAVCKDQFEVGEEGKQLPCSHLYHGDCIIPWLGIRNTCPVCRFELPTDDPDYEQRRSRRSVRAL